MLTKEQEKIAKYVSLAKDLTKVWKMSTKIVPVLIGGLGLGSLQTTAVVGTYNILCKLLNRKE